MLLSTATAVSVAALLCVRSFVPFLLVVCVYATAQSGLAAARQSLLAGLVPRGERTGVLAHLQATGNAGIAVGAAIGAVALHLGTPAAYLSVLGVDAVAFAACALLLGRLPSPAPAGTPGPGGEAGRGGMAVLRDRPYALVTFLNMVMLLRMPLISLAIPLWIVEHTAAPGWTVSALLVLNTGGVMLFQVRTAAGVTGLPSAVGAVRSGGVVMFASCLVFALSGAAGGAAWAAVAALLVGAALQVWGEMRQSAGAWQISFDLAPAGQQGQYQGFFGAGVPVARMLGPVLLTTLVLTWGTAGWVVLGGLFLAAGLAMGPVVRHAERRAGAVTSGAADVRRATGCSGT